MKIGSIKHIILSCFLASTLEIYDFAIFGFLSSALHKNYLSFLDKDTALLVTYSFFAVGFLFRPIGSIIFGYIGDIFGRRKSLIISVSLMGISSLTMFALPTYEAIGIYACLIIVLVRIVQGISVGGEFTGAIIFVMEHAPKKSAGFAVGIISAGGACGVLLASSVSSILQEPALPEYSWRFAFLVGFSLSILGYYIRKNLQDTPVFAKIKQSKRIPLIEGFVKYKTEGFAAICLAAANGTTFYFGAVFLGKYAQTMNPDESYSYISILVSCTMALSLPLFGYISDLFDRKKLLLMSTFIMTIFGIVSVSLVINYPATTAVIYTLCASFMIGSINIFAAEIFPAKVRMSCCSLFYSLGMGVIGGTVPMVAAYITTEYAGNAILLGGYIGLICFLAFVSVYFVNIKIRNKKEEYGDMLLDSGLQTS